MQEALRRFSGGSFWQESLWVELIRLVGSVGLSGFVRRVGLGKNRVCITLNNKTRIICLMSDSVTMRPTTNEMSNVRKDLQQSDFWALSLFHTNLSDRESSVYTKENLTRRMTGDFYLFIFLVKNYGGRLRKIFGVGRGPKTYLKICEEVPKIFFFKLPFLQKKLSFL